MNARLLKLKFAGNAMLTPEVPSMVTVLPPGRIKLPVVIDTAPPKKIVELALKSPADSVKVPVKRWDPPPAPLKTALDEVLWV